MIRTQTGIFGGDVFPTAWIHARRKLLSFWKQNKRSLGVCLVFAWLLHSKATQGAIFSGENPGKPQIRNNGAAITDHQPKMLCAPNQMIEARKRRKGQKHESWMHIRKLSHCGWFFFSSFFSSCCFPFSTNVNTPIPIQNKINWRRQEPVWVSPVISVLWFFHEL